MNEEDYALGLVLGVVAVLVLAPIGVARIPVAIPAIA